MEEQRRDLLQENKQLTENIADYRSKILNLEREISSTHTHSSDRVTKVHLFPPLFVCFFIFFYFL